MAINLPPPPPVGGQLDRWLNLMWKKVTGAAQIAVTQISGMGTGVSTFLTSPTSANLRAALTDEVGTGSAVFASSGSWTPAFSTSNSDSTITHAGQVGDYIKMGNLVFCYMSIGVDIGGVVAAGTGDLVVTGLPFTPAKAQRCVIEQSGQFGATTHPFALSVDVNDKIYFWTKDSADVRDGTTTKLVSTDLVATANLTTQFFYAV